MRDAGVKMAFSCFVLGLGRRAGLLPQALVCMYECMYACAWVPETGVAGSCELPGTEPRSSARAGSAVSL